MKSATIRSAADMENFQQWLGYYTETFARISDSALTGYWYMYGRDSEAPGTPRDEAAYAAVNAEITARDMQP
jgi:hypothetical protein